MADSPGNPAIRELIPEWIVDLNVVDEPIADGLPVEDGAGLARQAWDVLKAERGELKLPDLEIYPLPEFIREFPCRPLSIEERATIIDQAVLMFKHLYAHLPFKQQQFSFADPLQQLRELQAKLAAVTEAQFHVAMIRACNSVVDTHTLYGAPPPLSGAVAFLPFQLRAYQDQDGHCRFAVARVMKSRPEGGFGHPFFAPGAEITHMNWFAAQLYVQESPDRLPSGNPVCRAARGAMSATVRPLGFCPLPAMVPMEQMPAGADSGPVDAPPAWPFGEETTTIHYHPAGSLEHKAIRFPWAVATGLGYNNTLPTSVFSVSSPHRVAGSMDRILVQRDELVEQRRTEIGLGLTPFMTLPDDDSASAHIDLTRESKLPSVFVFQYTGGLPNPGLPGPEILRDECHPDGKYGYLKIRNFTGEGAGTDEMVAEFQRILALMNDHAPDGLVLDVRGNPGGDILAAERMPQMLTGRRITPAFFHLANTPAVQAMLQLLRENGPSGEKLTLEQAARLPNALQELRPWLDDSGASGNNDGPLTTGHQLTSAEAANSVGRVYRGPSVLVTDVGTYSAGDMFAAAYQDHEIGPVIGVDPSTGGGGGNVWTHEDTLRNLPATDDLPFRNLPDGVTLSLAIRRSVRTGINSGMALEDAGVTADLHFPPDSPQRLLDGFPGVIHHACRLLGAGRRFRLRIGAITVVPDASAVNVELDLENVDNVCFLINSRLAVSMPAAPGSSSFTAPLDPAVLTYGEPGAFLLSVKAFATLPGDHGLEEVLVATTAQLVRWQPPPAAGG